VIALENIDAGQLPSKLAIGAPTMREVAAGPTRRAMPASERDVKIPYNEPRLNLVKRRGRSCVIGSGY
jgi:hypothetical protein